MIDTTKTKNPWGWLDLNFVWKYRNKDATDYTIIDNKNYSIPELKNVIYSQGLIDPLVLRVCIQGTKGSIRLEEGNHRIQALRATENKVPVVIVLAETPIGNLGNGCHLHPLDMSLIKCKVMDLPFGKYIPSMIFNFVE